MYELGNTALKFLMNIYKSDVQIESKSVLRSFKRNYIEIIGNELINRTNLWIKQPPLQRGQEYFRGQVNQPAWGESWNELAPIVWSV